MIVIKKKKHKITEQQTPSEQQMITLLKGYKKF